MSRTESTSFFHGWKIVHFRSSNPQGGVLSIKAGNQSSGMQGLSRKFQRTVYEILWPNFENLLQNHFSLLNTIWFLCHFQSGHISFKIWVAFKFIWPVQFVASVSKNQPGTPAKSFQKNYLFSSSKGWERHFNGHIKKSDCQQFSCSSFQAVFVTKKLQSSLPGGLQKLNSRSEEEKTAVDFVVVHTTAFVCSA